MSVVTDEIVETFLGAFQSDLLPGDASIGDRIRGALEAVVPMIAGAGASFDSDTLLDQLPNDHFAVWEETVAP